MSNQVAQQFISALPHARALGMDLVTVQDGGATIRMPYDPRLIGDAETGVIHGGAVSALIDTACGAAVLSHPAGPMSVATLDLRIDYMRSAVAGQAIVATAECYHMANSVAFVRATAFDDDMDNPVASAAGTFTVTALAGKS